MTEEQQQRVIDLIADVVRGNRGETIDTSGRWHSKLSREEVDR
jgi:hypothetical protein